MARPNSIFKQGDVTRAVKAVVAAEQRISRIGIDKDGKIEIVLVTDNEATKTAVENEWDRDLA